MYIPIGFQNLIALDWNPSHRKCGSLGQRNLSANHLILNPDDKFRITRRNFLGGFQNQKIRSNMTDRIGLSTRDQLKIRHG